jgi:hypothetical protein
VFDFKYVPDFHVTTAAGEDDAIKVKQHGVERRNFRVLLIGSAFAGLVSYGCVWLGSVVIRNISTMLVGR